MKFPMRVFFGIYGFNFRIKAFNVILTVSRATNPKVESM